MASDWALHRWKNLCNVLKVCYGDAYSRDAITEALDAAINLGHTEARCELGTALQEARAEGFKAGQLAMRERAAEEVKEPDWPDFRFLNRNPKAVTLENIGNGTFQKRLAVQQVKYFQAVIDAIRALEPVEEGEEKTDVGDG